MYTHIGLGIQCASLLVSVVYNDNNNKIIK